MGLDSQARFSRLGTTLVALAKSNVRFARRNQLRADTGYAVSTKYDRSRAETSFDRRGVPRPSLCASATILRRATQKLAPMPDFVRSETSFGAKGRLARADDLTRSLDDFPAMAAARLDRSHQRSPRRRGGAPSPRGRHRCTRGQADISSDTTYFRTNARGPYRAAETVIRVGPMLVSHANTLAASKSGPLHRSRAHVRGMKMFPRFVRRTLPVLTLLALLSTPPALAEVQDGHHHPARHSHNSHHHSNGSGSADTYTNVDGRRVHRPVFTHRAPRGASAQCRDGSYSFSLHHRGTCSHHGGVARWL